jgi:hypothetical protein
MTGVKKQGTEPTRNSMYGSANQKQGISLFHASTCFTAYMLKKVNAAAKCTNLTICLQDFIRATEKVA